ncbi:Maf family protein [soil metagenome]
MIWLASQSPRRADLLRQIGVSFELLVADADEDSEALEVRLGREPPARYVTRVCALKAEAALQRLERRGLPKRPILCADTTVAQGSMIHGKPVDAADAAAILSQLSGTTHRVLTAVTIVDGSRSESALSISTLRMARLDAKTIDDYIASGEPFGKAGAYAAQGRGAAFIEHLSGSHSGVIGLPLHETVRLLASFTIGP